MTHPAEKFDHPQHDDWDSGREDASQFNPYSTPGTRSGDALAAYLAGYQFGSECMDQYYAEQDE